MDHSIFNTVRSAINQIHQYDESTTLKGEALDGDLKEVEQNCKALKEKLVELRRQRNEYERRLEEASFKRQMAKRSFDQKAGLATCLEAEVERLDTHLKRQEQDVERYLEATRTEKISELIESFQGIKLEKETKLDEIRSACEDKKKRIAQLEADMQENEKTNQAKIKEMTEYLASKEASTEAASEKHVQLQGEITQLNSSIASTSGKLKFLEEKHHEGKTKFAEVETKLKAAQFKRDNFLREEKELQNKHIILLDKHNTLEAIFQEKFHENGDAIENIQKLQITMDELNEANIKLEKGKNDFIAVTENVTKVEMKVNQLKEIEKNTITTLKETESLRSKRVEQQELLNAAIERLQHLNKVQEDVLNDQKKLKVLTNKHNDVMSENDELSSKVENLNQELNEAENVAISVADEMSECAKIVISKDEEVSQKQSTLEQMSTIRDMVQDQIQKINEFDVEITRLEEHQNHVTNEIEEQGKVEYDKMDRELSATDKNIEAMLQKSQELEFKIKEDAENHTMQVSAIKGQRNENIDKLVTNGIAEIDNKLKKMDEEMRQRIDEELRKRIDEELRQRLNIKESTPQNQTEQNPKDTSGVAKQNNPIEKMELKNNDSDIEVSENSDSDSDIFGGSDTTSDEAVVASSQTSITPGSQGRQKRLLMKTSVKKVGATSKASLDKAPQDESTGINDKTPGRQKRFLNKTPLTSKPSVQSSTASTSKAPLKDNRSLSKTKSEEQSSGHKENRAPTATTPGSGRQKRTLSIGKKSGYMSGASSADEDTLRPIQAPQTPGSRRDKKRYLMKTPTKATRD